MTNQSVIAVQVFDQKKFKKKDQGFLGVINVQISNVFDLEVGGDGIYTEASDCNDWARAYESPLWPIVLEMLTLDLKKSNANENVHGKLILNISTNVNMPIRNGTNTLVPGTHNASSSTSSLSRTGAQTSTERPTSSASAVASSSANVAAAAATSSSAAAASHTDDRNDLPPG